MSNSNFYIGIMSGTSLDGVDVALVISSHDDFKLVDTYFLPYDTTLKGELITLHTPSHNELEQTYLTANILAKLYAKAVHALLANNHLSAKDITAIGCHGQTIRHRPELGFTIQIANYALLAELTEITVVGDFRSRDIAAGGQGAPLVPAFHQAIFGDEHTSRAIVNIGGIANITYLPKNGPVLGFDSGPGNMLIDSWTKLKTNNDYDSNGDWAATGAIQEAFLINMLAEPYFSLPPPKSTGRDLFNDNWLNQHILYPHCKPEDIAKTLVALTAQTIAQSIQHYCNDVETIYICGGGAHNTLMLAMISAQLPKKLLTKTDTLGINVDWVEAVAFAWLAKQTMTQQTSNLPSVTGAAGLRSLGCIYPA